LPVVGAGRNTCYDGAMRMDEETFIRLYVALTDCEPKCARNVYMQLDALLEAKRALGADARDWAVSSIYAEL
jgi:hypothetical protein